MLYEVITHSSDDRNTIVNVDASISSEFDYNSFGFGGGLTKLVITSYSIHYTKLYDRLLK